MHHRPIYPSLVQPPPDDRHLNIPSSVSKFVSVCHIDHCMAILSTRASFRQHSQSTRPTLITRMSPDEIRNIYCRVVYIIYHPPIKSSLSSSSIHVHHSTTPNLSNTSLTSSTPYPPPLPFFGNSSVNLTKLCTNSPPL